MSAAGAGLLLATFYPLAAEWALARWGVRAVAALLLVPGLFSLALWRRHARRLRAPLWPHAVLLALPVAALASGSQLWLRLLPAAIQLLIAVFFALSLRGGSSILERAAQTLHPYAPAFIGPYCRKATLAFAAIFAAQGAGLAALAWWPPASWALASGAAAWLPVTAATAVEWAIRKSHFRYYSDGPVDRLLRRWLPPEGTAAGRRSLEYIRAKRLELGMPPP